MKLTALGLEEGVGSDRLWLGLPLLTAGVVGLTCFRRAGDLAVAEARQPARGPARGLSDADAGRRLARPVLLLQVLAVVGLQLIVFLEFALMLDGHVHLRACCWLYLVYAAGAVLVLAGRKASPGWASAYLQWGWAPILAFGVPLALPTLKAAGLVPFSPLAW
jgi:hypothetical protein